MLFNDFSTNYFISFEIKKFINSRTNDEKHEKYFLRESSSHFRGELIAISVRAKLRELFLIIVEITS